MKTAGLILILTVALLQPIYVGAEEEHQHTHEEPPQLMLNLNAGQKWTADKHTVESVTSMRDSVHAFQDAAEGAGLEQLQEVGQGLQEQLHALIRGCTMSGPEHDQLHVWIAMLAPEIQALSQAADAETGLAALHRISALLDAFNQHFTLGPDAAPSEAT